ncbi:MAG: hypothetical protein IT373_08420 [Polyangiaceae bacterium]|nr:hypothetical protein [Polyangiaceae bacterium]
MSPPGQWDVARRSWAVLLTGIPFAVFKVGGGVIAYGDIHPWLGGAVVAWGLVDLVLNLLSLFFAGTFSPCLLSNVGRHLETSKQEGSRELLGLAVDTLFSFTIVATVILFRRLGSLPPAMIRVWEISVIANVMGAGLERVWLARRSSPAP